MRRFFKKYITIIAMAFVLLAGFFSPLASTGAIAHAAGKTYSDVLSDLQKDSAFDINDYPKDPTDHSLQVIQLAESEDGELFIYVYRPCADIDFTATTINISTGINANASWHNYTLSLLSTQGVLDKYIVENFVVLPDALRYYNISSIFRKWVGGVDAPTENDNTISEVSYEVSKLYTASTVLGNVSYTCLETEDVVITKKYCGYIRYNSGFLLMNSACFSHYVAFDTDWDIDALLEADVEYISRSYVYSSTYTGNLLVPGSERWSYGEEETIFKTLYCTDEAEYDPGGWWRLSGKYYSWNRIESIDDFKADTALTDEALQELDGMKWVLRFEETEFAAHATANSYYETGTDIRDVTLLRLKFEKAGLIYNLGVVDNKQTEGAAPSNDPSKEKPNATYKWWQWLISILGLILILAILAPILPLIIQGVIWLIMLPFKLIGAIVKGVRSSAKKKKQE